MEIIYWIYKELGSIVCHQIPERTLAIDGVLLPVCSRDTGICFGIFVSLLYLLFCRRIRCDKPPGMISAILLCVMMVPMMIDGVSSYAGIRHTTNPIRLFTGIYFGIPIPFLLIPAVNFKIHEVNSRPVIYRFYEIFIIAGIGFCGGMAILYSNVFPWIVLGSIFLFSLVFLPSQLIYTLVKRTRGPGKYNIAITVLCTMIVLSLMFILSNYLIKPLYYLY